MESNPARPSGERGAEPRAAAPSLTALVAAFRVLGDRTRLKIVKLLAREELCVCELVHLLGLSQPAVSQHLAKLKAAGLVRERRVGQWVVHRLDRERLLAAVNGFAAFLESPLEDTPGLEAEAARRHTLPRAAVCGPEASPPPPTLA